MIILHGSGDEAGTLGVLAPVVDLQGCQIA